MPTHSKIFYHTGSPCHGCDGISHHWQSLDREGVPFAVYSVEGGGLIAEAARYANADHTLIYRTLATDVADYSKAPDIAAVNAWTLLMFKLPPEIKALKDRCWIEIGNEQDKNRSNWLGYYYVSLGMLALAEGYRIMGPGFSTGEPEPEHWETPGWKAYLKLAEKHPDRLAISTHEYSLNRDDIFADSPWLVGRFKFLLDACANMGIKSPQIFITEAGWVHDGMPGEAAAREQIQRLAEFYAQYPNVRAAFLWTLIGGADKKELAARLNSLMPWLTTYSLVASFPDVDEPDEEDEEEPMNEFYKALWAASVAEQIARGIPLNPGAAIQLRISATGGAGLQVVTRESRFAHGGKDYTYQVAEDIKTGRRFVFYCVTGRWNEISIINGLGDKWEGVGGGTPDASPFDGLVFGQPLSTAWRVSSPFNAPRNYSTFGGKVNDKHEGVDVAPTASGPSNVLAVADGLVTAVRQSSGYGKYVIVDSSYQGRAFQTWRAHMDSIAVTIGQMVKRGDVLGVCGATGNATGRHDHLTMTSIHGGMSDYIVAGVVDPTPFYPQPGVTPPAAQTVDLLPFIRANHRVQFDLGYNGGTQTTMVWHLDTNNWLFVKGEDGEYERLGLRVWQGQEWIWRFDDTSESPTRFYAHYMSDGGAIGAPWLPRFAEPGKWYETSKFVQHYLKAGCVKQNSGNVTDRLRLIAKPAAKTYQESGRTLASVITLEWSSGEQYDFAEGRGNVAFRDVDRNFWFLGDLHGREDKTWRKPGCLALGW